MGFLAGHLSVAAPSPLLLAAAKGVQHRLVHRGACQATWSGGSLARGFALLLAEEEARAPGLRVAFDGRLIGRDVLRSRLEAEGHAVSGETDADLVAAGWRAWGADLLPRLRGAFAFAVQDEERGILVLVRDRFGERPLLHARTTAGGFAFASELQALLAWPGVARSPDLNVIAAVLAFGHGPVERTPLSGVHRVAPGHMLIVDADGSIEERCWWALPDAPGQGVGAPLLPSAALTERIIQTVRDYGAQADAGPLAGAHGAGVISACFAQEARTPAASSALPLPIEPDPGLLRRLVRHRGEPITPEDLLPALAAGRPGGVFIAPVGAGELLLTQGRYAAFTQNLTRLRQRFGTKAHPRAGGFHDGLLTVRDIWHGAAGVMSEAERLEMAGPALIHTAVFAMPDAYGLSLESASPGDAMARAARLDLAMRLPARELPSLDVAGALNGTHFVCPLLDGELAELLVGLPDAARRWLMPAVPSAALAMSAWHPLAPALREFTEDMLLGQTCRSRDLLSAGRVEAFLRRPDADQQRHAARLWALLGTELWCQAFLDMAANEAEAADAPTGLPDIALLPQVAA